VTAAFIAAISGKTISGPAQPVLVNAQGQLGTNSGASASTAALAATVERLQRQVRRLRERVKGG
jgi:ribosome-associated translation inhibitor RaiA